MNKRDIKGEKQVLKPKHHNGDRDLGTERRAWARAYIVKREGESDFRARTLGLRWSHSSQIAMHREPGNLIHRRRTKTREEKEILN